MPSNALNEAVNDPTSANLLGMSRQQLEAFFASYGEPKFRAQQWMKWAYQQNVLAPDSMTDLSKGLRELLNAETQTILPELIREQISSDGTTKWLLQLNGGDAIETVFIPEKSRGTLCISSQVGCALDCTFCATARQGFSRNLSADEIIAQLWLASHQLRLQENLDRKITNVVMMGMGEPLLNFESVVSALHVMVDDYAYGLGKRKVTVSTSGVVPRIDKLREEIDVSLAVSLHAPNNELRTQLVPLNRKYPIEELLAACKRYLQGKNRKESITFEYAMLREVNDSEKTAKELVSRLRNIRAKVNLIPFNPFPNAGYQRSTDKKISKFAEILADAGITTITRRPRGEDIDAACGQLAGQVSDRSHRGEHYARLYERSILDRRFEIACAS